MKTTNEYHANGVLKYTVTRKEIDNTGDYQYVTVDPDGKYWARVGVMGKYNDQGIPQWEIDYQDGKKGSLILYEGFNA